MVRVALTRHSFEEFAQLRDRLAAVLEGIAGVFAELDEPARGQDLNRATRNLVGDRFQVLIMGEMKQGKSTLVNAFLGEEVLPTQFGEACTAIPISVRWGERRRALCYRRTQEPAEEIDLARDPARFREAVTIPPPLRRPGPGDATTAQKLHPYVRAEVEAPLELLRQGVELIDSPGLNEDAERSEHTWDKVEDSGAVILMLDCHKLGRQSDQVDLKNIIAKGRDPRVIFVVWNYFDLCPTEEARMRTRALGTSIATQAGIPEGHVHFTCASQAFEARTKNDATLLGASGLHGLTDSLADFLVNERMSAKLLTPLGVGERAVAEALQDVLAKRTVLCTCSVQRTAEVLRQARDQDQGAQAVEIDLSRATRRIVERLIRDVRASVAELVDDLCDGVEGATNSVELSNWDAVWKKTASKQLLMSKVKEWVEEETMLWEQRCLRPLLQECAQELGDAGKDAMANLAERGRILSDLYNRARQERQQGLATVVHDIGIGLAKDTKAAQSAGSLNDGLLAEMSLLTGASVGAVAGAVVGTWLTVTVLAVPFLPLIAALALLGAVVGGLSASGILKARAAATAQKGMRENAKTLEQDIVKQVRRNVGVSVNAVESKVAAAREAIRKLVNAIEREHAENERRAAEQVKRMSLLRSQLQGFADELDALRAEVDPVRSMDQWVQQATQRYRLPPEKDGTATSAPRLSVAEMETKLDAKAMERLEKVGECLRYHGRWDEQSREKILAAWCQLPPLSDQASRQVPAFRAAAAMAVSSGMAELPDPKEVRGWWDDPVLREALLDLYEAVTGEQHDYERATSVEGRDRHRGLFVLAYGRALKAVIGSEARTATQPG